MLCAEIVAANARTIVEYFMMMVKSDWVETRVFKNE
jgi:hypothetical protein